MEELTQEQIESKFKNYLELTYSKSTIDQYFKSYKRYYIEYNNFKEQKDIDKFMRFVSNRNNNPHYTGFLGAYIDCFELTFKIIKSKRKNQHIKKEYKFLKKEEIDLMISKLFKTHPKMVLMIRLYFETGLRLNELLNAKRDDIDIPTRSIKGIGKGNKPFVVNFSIKTSKLLEDFLIYKQKTEYPFHNLFGNYQNQGRMFYYYLKKLCNEIGIKDVHPHRLRHSLGYYLRANKGWDLQQIKVKLRHASLGTTDIYAPSTEEEVRKKMEEEVFEDA